MHVMNTDALSNWSNLPYKCLQMTEKEKKRKYLETFLCQNHHFSPFVVSVVGLIGVEAEAALKRVAIRLKTKWKTLL